MCEDYPEFWNQTERTARKDYRCGTCPRVIPAGSLYVYTASLFDGEIQTDREHLECSDFCSRVRGLDGDCQPGAGLRFIDRDEFMVSPAMAHEYRRLTGRGWDGGITTNGGEPCRWVAMNYWPKARPFVTAWARGETGRSRFRRLWDGDIKRTERVLGQVTP